MYIAGFALAFGGIALAAVAGAARLARSGRVDWKTLTMALVPIGGVGLFLGLSMLTVTQLRDEHIALPYVGAARVALLAGSIAWSAWLGARIVLGSGAPRIACAIALALYAVPLAAHRLQLVLRALALVIIALG